MSASGETLCITCGKTAGEPPQLNHLASGEVCPSCHARFLDAQPPLLPGFGYAPAAAREGGSMEEGAGEGEETGEHEEAPRTGHLKLVAKRETPQASNDG